MTFALKRALYITGAAVVIFLLQSSLLFVAFPTVMKAVLFWTFPLIPASWYLVLSDYIRQKQGKPKRNCYLVMAVFVAAIIVLGTLLALWEGSFVGAYWFLFVLWCYCVLLVAILLLWKNIPQTLFERFKAKTADKNQSTERTDLK